jgi:cytochrome c biogenesis protein CcdA
MSGLLTGTTLFASFLGGMVALFAPCCISVMLPAYFATSFGRRLRLVLMTFVFAAGVATIILPIALGAAGIGSVVQDHHTLIFGAGGLMMLSLGVFTLAGGRLALPMPGMRPASGRGPLAVYSLGLFSGVASSCCAPVLAGVIALSGLSGSYMVALAIGVAYVFGMVFPMFALALVWDRFNWGESRLLRGRTVRMRVGRRQVSVHSTALVAGGLLVGMGLFTLVIAAQGKSMRSSGWQASLSAQLQHYAHVATVWAGDAPGWVSAAVVAGALLGLGWIALNQATATPQPPDDHPPEDPNEQDEHPPSDWQSAQSGTAS